MTNARETILPLQARSGVAGLDDHADVAVRIRTRGPLTRPLPTQDARPLRALIDTLRAEARALPLVSVIIGGATRSGSLTRRFLDALLPLIDARFDVIWQMEPAATPAAQVEAIAGPVVVLRRTRENDRRIAANLVADLLFVAGESAAEEKTLRAFAGRAPFVIAPSTAPRLEHVIAAAIESRLPVLLLDLTGPAAVKAPAPATLRRISRFSSRILGEELRELAFRIAFRHDRRLLFRQTLAQFAATRRWPERVIDLAEKAQWPAWAVQSIPQRYIEVKREDTHVIALVWQPFLEGVERLPNVHTIAPFCGGEILRVRAPLDVGEFLKDLDGAFAKYVDQSYKPDYAFFQRVSETLDVMANVWEARFPNVPRVPTRMRAVAQRVTRDNADRWLHLELET